ncbi:MAG: hypothetical protein IIA73_05930 [Proteobacteria bacterium]|nr:hypothetical protein [Pseudomonadota bacterium]
MLDRRVEGHEPGGDLLLYLRQGVHSFRLDAGGLELSRQAGELSRSLFQPGLREDAFLLIGARHQRRRRSRNLRALLGEAQRNRHRRDAPGGDAVDRSLDGDESVPGDRRG